MQWPVCFVRDRLAFVRSDSTQAGAWAGGSHGQQLTWGARVGNPHGVVVYMGPDIKKFASVFGRIGSIPGATAWAMPHGINNAT